MVKVYCISSEIFLKLNNTKQKTFFNLKQMGVGDGAFYQDKHTYIALVGTKGHNSPL